MKKIKFVASLALIFAAFIILDSCKEKSTAPEPAQETTSQETGVEYESKYICPMHCKGSGSAEEGTCPVCEMDYVLNKKYKDSDGDGHNHEHGDEGHEHEHDHEHGDGHDHDHG